MPRSDVCPAESGTRCGRAEVAITLRAFVVVLTLLSAVPASAATASGSRAAFRASLDRMMVGLGPESAKASKSIRQAYRSYLDLLLLHRYADLETQLASGGLAPLPSNPLRFNLEPRTSGPSPIGEKDLANQRSYLAARPATIGCLIEVASRVRSGPLEITSLVRHGEYQQQLTSTNGNAVTSVPMHTMGLAFDIALVNSSLATARETRKVLRQMRDAGDLLFIGERRQLVFHVVPRPERLGHFNAVYDAAFGAAPAALAAVVVAKDPRPETMGVALRGPHVTVDIVAVRPADEELPATRSMVDRRSPAVALHSSSAGSMIESPHGKSACVDEALARSGVLWTLGLLATVTLVKSQRMRPIA